MRLLLLVSALLALACGQKAPAGKTEASGNNTTPASTSETTVLVMPGGEMNTTADNSTVMSNATVPTMPPASSNYTMKPNVKPTPVSEAGTEPTVHVDQTTEPVDHTTAHPHGNSSAVLVTSASAVSLCLVSLLVLS